MTGLKSALYAIMIFQSTYKNSRVITIPISKPTGRVERRKNNCTEPAENLRLGRNDERIHVGITIRRRAADANCLQLLVGTLARNIKKKFATPF